MPLTSLTIKGYRGFSAPARLNIAVPNGAPISGLTVLTGSNNSGKSTIIEALRYLARGNAPTFTEGKRNKAAGDRVFLRAEFGPTHFREIETVATGGSESEIREDLPNPRPTIHALPSRRAISPFFGRSQTSRSDFSTAWEIPTTRNSELSGFTGRLFVALRERARFSPMLERILGHTVNWTIDQNDSSQHFVKFELNGASHNSDGAGDGLMGAFCLADAFYDSVPGDIIIIDEPELSLHPSLQRRAFNVIRELSKDRQIILSTHSPYFVPAAEDCGAGEIARVARENGGCKIHQPDKSLTARIAAFSLNWNNPHIFGFDARQVLLGEDGIILVEGQEDVVCYRAIAEQLGHQLADNFWGWGVGGAGNFALIAEVLKEMGFTKVVGVLDANQESTVAALATQFPTFKFFQIPTNDVRTKQPILAKPAVVGLLDANHRLDPSHRLAVQRLFDDVSQYLST